MIALESQTAPVAEQLHTVGDIKQASSIDKAADLVKANFARSRPSLVRGLIFIFKHQTTEEQQAEQTVEHNAVGFTGPDGEILTSFAKQCLRWYAVAPEDRQYPHPLSDKQFALLAKRMPKYAKQIVRHIRANRLPE